MRYIGSKTLLLGNIKDVVDDNVISAETFCDIFSGTSTVARYFKKWYKVYSNDLLFFSYVLQKGTIENNCMPQFEILFKAKGIKDPINYFNDINLDEMEYLKQERRFFQNTYAPTGGRMYINDDNALRIDFVRNKLEEWKENNFINENEYFYLLACIIEGIPYISNISGTYGAFNKKWDKRSFKKYELYRLNIETNNRDNICYNQDGVGLLKNISGDILYIDPPYNNRQYLSNYHVLETAARYDYPEVKGITGQRAYLNEKSDFCLKGKALGTFNNLMKNANFKHIILSYSSEGIMKLSDIEYTMKSNANSNTFKVYEIPYRRYKSKNNIEKDTLKEYLIYISK